MGHTHLSFVVEITSNPPNPSLCISSVSSPPYWLLPPLKASTQLDMLAMVVFTELALLVLDMVAMLEDMPVLDTPVLDTLVLLTMPQLPQSLLPQLPAIMPSQLHALFPKNPLLKRS